MQIDMSPDWYFYAMHFSAIVTTPVNISGIMIILFCQTRQLSSLRWHLLVFQIFSMISDFSLNVGTLPVIFSPFPIGRPHGVYTLIFQKFGFETSTEAQCILVFVSIYLTAGSVEFLFLLRYQAILPSGHPHKLSTFISVLLLSIWQVFLITMMLISFKLAVPDQQVARALFAQLHPELQYLMTDEHVFIVCVVVELIHVIFLFSCFFRLGIGMVTVIVLIWMSSRSLKSIQISLTTKRMHLQLIKSLCQQIIVPILAFYIPIIVVVVPLMLSIPNSQLSFFISLICLSYHTFFGTLSMLYFNPHYRQWVISAVRNRPMNTSTALTSKFVLARERSNFNAGRNVSAVI
ncbi:Serpentine Receptor, class H [Caenorhabditis elegans]|uniref:Serpentine Receptor, class H n=1 Tax=Caenorhabditis elegans TaxID=6239 RepID=O45478_CAEEL|nr:Serpentine Receptor, class H [Caenorhabditis elegans]CAB04339.1 Serpentine Receptor, class H [Caenorhabditis elegans]|eukprot:NP_507001.1 Serpentine Receptor, class I [Caenorhabditis elegans]